MSRCDQVAAVDDGVDPSRFRTFPVLAAAYPKHRQEGPFLTHVWDDLEDHPLCKSVKPEHICVDYALDGQHEPATCTTCAKRDPRPRGVR